MSIDHDFTFDSSVRLQFALRGDSPVFIREFSHLRGTEGGRDGLRCPECDRSVTARLSPKFAVADHFAHYPGSRCVLSGAGESTRHANAKYFIAGQLKKYQRASLIFQCKACRNDNVYLQIPEYDEVKVERRLANRRPDISCYQGETPVGAVEVTACHAINFARRVDLDQTGVAWFEIAVDRAVNPRYFRFVESASILGIDAEGAGVTYPRPPKYCPLCQARNQARSGKATASPDAAASALLRIPEWTTGPGLTMDKLCDYAWHEGVSLECDEWGPRLAPGLSPGLYISIVNFRTALYSAMKHAAHESGHPEE